MESLFFVWSKTLRNDLVLGILLKIRRGSIILRNWCARFVLWRISERQFYLSSCISCCVWALRVPRSTLLVWLGVHSTAYSFVSDEIWCVFARRSKFRSDWISSFNSVFICFSLKVLLGLYFFVGFILWDSLELLYFSDLLHALFVLSLLLGFFLLLQMSAVTHE